MHRGGPRLRRLGRRDHVPPEPPATITGGPHPPCRGSQPTGTHSHLDCRWTIPVGVLATVPYLTAELSDGEKWQHQPARCGIRAGLTQQVFRSCNACYARLICFHPAEGFRVVYGPAEHGTVLASVVSSRVLPPFGPKGRGAGPHRRSGSWKRT